MPTTTESLGLGDNSVPPKPNRSKERALMKLCRELFAISNLIGTDFDEIHVSEVKGKNFPQQPDGAGLNISFSVSNHALGKMSAVGHEARKALAPSPAERIQAGQADAQAGEPGAQAGN